MRRVSVLLVPLLVILLQADAYGRDHWRPIRGISDLLPDQSQTALSAIMVGAAIAILAWFIIRFLGAKASPAFALAVGSYATAILVGEYVQIFGFGVVLARENAQIVAGAIGDIVVIIVMLVWAAPYYLGKQVSLMDALKVAAVPPLLPVLFDVLLRR